MVPDSYTRRARIYPALLAALPGLALAAVVVSWKDLGISHAIATVAAGFLLYAFGDLTRRLGKRHQDAIYRGIGGKPSTAMLRHSDTTFDEATKSAWLKFLAGKIGGPPPTVEKERTDPAAADTYYARCGNWLRENTRDNKKFKLAFEENVAYGFRRNLYGLKWLGLAAPILVQFAEPLDTVPDDCALLRTDTRCYLSYHRRIPIVLCLQFLLYPANLFLHDRRTARTVRPDHLPNGCRIHRRSRRTRS